MFPCLRALMARLRPLRLMLGEPQRATIAPAACGGYLLLLDYSNGREWLDLPDRVGELGEYSHPDDRDFATAQALLADRGLAWLLPWQLDRSGNLTAPVVPLAACRAGVGQ